MVSTKSGIFTGLAGLDIVYYQNNTPRENKKSKTNDYKVLVGGPAANAAITYAMLGGKPLLITCIGNSEYGRSIKKELYDYGVEVIDMAETSNCIPNISSISVNLSNASRTIWSGQQFYEINNTLDISQAISNASFCFSDCNMFDMAVRVLEKAKEKAKPIVLDAGSWKENFEVYLSMADDVIASADCNPPEGDFISVALRFGVKNAAVTHGEGNIIWNDGTSSGMVTPPRVNAIDTLGAGDVFHGAYCYFKFFRGFSFEDSLKNASQVASMSVQYPGPREGVEKYIEGLQK